jgi:ATP/maltotriose-dependent transcriptional regulator MalT
LRAIGGAEDRARQAVASAGALPASDPAREILINVLCLRSAALWYLGQLTQSEETARMCLSACTEARWPRAEAYPLRDLAEIAIHRGDYRQAREWIGSARARAEDWSDVRQLIRLDLTEARLLLMTGRLRRARSLAHRAAEEAESLALGPEAKESAALRRAAGRPLSVVRYKRHRPLRLTDAPVGGD